MSDRTESVAVVLAAGKGTRMKSDLPKVLCQAHGRPLIDWVLDALERAGIDRCIVVVGYRADDVKAHLAARPNVDFVLQEEQLGTGHAVQVCEPLLSQATGAVLVVAGDSPMIQSESIRRLLEAFDEGEYGCLLGTLNKPDPQGLGRIVREEGAFVGIVEEKDATDEQKRITEVNMSTYVFSAPRLRWALSQLTNDNRQGEYYLTDCPAILLRAGDRVDALPVLQPCEALSVNTAAELSLVEAELKKLAPS